MLATETRDVGRKPYLPPINSKRYYVLLAVVAIFILGPLGGISSAYMNFSLGFFGGVGLDDVGHGRAHPGDGVAQPA